MIKAKLTSTGWAVDKPKETVYDIPEDAVAYEQTNKNGSKQPVTFGELYSVFKDRKTYVKVDVGYETSNITPEAFENWFFRHFVPKETYDRMISIKFEQI